MSILYINTIRTMRSGDIPEVACLMEKGSFHGWGQKAYQDTLEDENKIYLVCCGNDRIMGCCAVWCSYETADLCYILVDAHYRRRGIAQGMLEQAIGHSRVLGAGRMLLEVRQGNHAAIGLYEKFSFEQIAVRKAYYHDPLEDALIMQKIYG